MRVKLTMPEKSCFHCRIQVRATDLNYGNHLGNDRILVYVQEARVQWLASLGYTELNLEGVGLIMADAMIQFRGEAFLHDEVNIEVAISEIQSRSFNLYYRLFTKRNSSIMEIAVAKTGMVAFNYTDKKVGFIAEIVLRKLQLIGN